MIDKLRRFYNYMVTWNQHRKVIKDLHNLTDKQLEDIGIPRGRIEELIWETSE